MIDTEALRYAKQLVSINSVNNTEGESRIADWIEDTLRSFAYFQKHPEYVIAQPLKNDRYGRKNILAFVKGEKGNKPDTLIFHGHIDTVGIEDFGPLKEWACDPDALQEKMLESNIPDALRKDLETGDYMVGRGSCDMKSGDAVNLSLLHELSENPESLSGNVLVMFNPVEENLHTGMVESLDVLLDLKEKYGFDYKLAINNDFTCPGDESDKKVTLYAGMAGKLLPCFYIQGAETHVGQPFEGLDAAETAARLVSLISRNPAYADTWLEETSCPPTVLKMKDLKEHYDVQTSKDAFVYFNYFVHNASPSAVIAQLKKAAGKVLQEREEDMKSYAFIWSGKDARTFEPCVYSFEELAAKEPDVDVNAEIRAEIEKGTDAREAAIPVIRRLLGKAGIHQPCVVLYFAPPYCPHNVIEDPSVMEKIMDETEKETGISYRLSHFYPSLSDSSYIAMDDDEKELEVLKNSFPGMDVIYPLPFEKIHALSIPAVNFGCYGKDAHKWTERVNVPYTFGILPILMRNAVKALLE